MTEPLPKELLEQLKELRDCAGMVYDCNYNRAERARLRKLQALGLVELAWVMNGNGKAKVQGR